MATNTTTKIFEINGVISTATSVLQNIESICRACSSWMTYDTHLGRWSVVINKPTNSVKSFNDSNIIGGITVSGTGIDDLYNAVSIEFPHIDLNDEKDYIDLSILDEDRYPNEIDNTLQIQLDCINNPVQAQLIAAMELNQSRLDKTIQFRTDYSSIGLKAGDVIDVTNDLYGFNEKEFRITNLEENDDGDGQLTITITALEYDISIYTNDDLVREQRDRVNGILPKYANTAIQSSDASANLVTTTTGLSDNTNNQPQITEFYGAIAPKEGVGGVSPSILAFRFLQNYVEPNVNLGYYFPSNFTLPYTGTYRIIYDLFWDLYEYPDNEPPLGAGRQSTIRVKLNGTNTTVENGFDGAVWDNFGDQHLIGWFNGNAGDIVTLGINLQTDYGPNYQNTIGTTVIWQAQPYSAVYVSGYIELYYDGTWAPI